MKAEVTKETDISTAIDLCGQGYNGRAAFLTSGPLRMSKRGSFEYLFKVPAIAVVKIDVTKFTEKCIGALITMVQTAEDEELPEDELSKLEIWANRIASYSSPGGEKEKETPRAKRAASSSLEPKEPVGAFAYARRSLCHV